jgi:arylsulfatase A-like enzyme
LPVLVENKRLNRDELFWHFPHYHGSGWKPGSALRKGDWKLVVHYEENKTELFNLAEDPGETTNLSEIKS